MYRGALVALATASWAASGCSLGPGAAELEDAAAEQQRIERLREEAPQSLRAATERATAKNTGAMGRQAAAAPPPSVASDAQPRSAKGSNAGAGSPSVSPASSSKSNAKKGSRKNEVPSAAEVGL